MFPDGDIAGPNSITAFYQSFEYTTDKMGLFWQPLSYYSSLSPTSFFVNDVPYSCAEQYLIAENTKLFQEH